MKPASLFWFFLKQVEKGNSEWLPGCLIQIKRYKLREAFVSIIRDQIHEKETEIATLKRDLNHLDAYSL